LLLKPVRFALYIKVPPIAMFHVACVGHAEAWPGWFEEVFSAGLAR